MTIAKIPIEYREMMLENYVLDQVPHPRRDSHGATVLAPPPLPLQCHSLARARARARAHAPRASSSAPPRPKQCLVRVCASQFGTELSAPDFADLKRSVCLTADDSIRKNDFTLAMLLRLGPSLPPALETRSPHPIFAPYALHLPCGSILYQIFGKSCEIETRAETICVDRRPHPPVRP